MPDRRGSTTPLPQTKKKPEVHLLPQLPRPISDLALRSRCQNCSLARTVREEELAQPRPKGNKFAREGALQTSTQLWGLTEKNDPQAHTQ